MLKENKERKNKTKRQRFRCLKHKAVGRSWDLYALSYASNGCEYYVCIECRDYEAKRDERRQRVMANETKQAHLSSKIWFEKFHARQAKRERLMQEQLWDCVVRRDLLKGVKNGHKLEITKEMLQVHRAYMKLMRCIKKKKEVQADIKKKEWWEEQEKKKPLMVCAKHGALFAISVIKSGKDKFGDQVYKCRGCMREYHRKNYQKNKEKIDARVKEWRANNPEKMKEIRRNYWREKNG